ncbi:MAG: ABC transporter permease [Bryobacteraceae bacterium]
MRFKRFSKWRDWMLYVVGRIWRRLSFWAQRDRLSRELAEELELHLHLKESAAQEKGGARNASQESRREMGNLALAEEESRDMWGFVSVDNLLRDIRYALRIFRRNPAFASIAILSLALGIAGNTAIFSIINTLLIKPLPFQEPSRLVRITQLYPKAILEYFQQRSKTMEIAFVSPGSEFNLTGEGLASRITGTETSANFFSVIGAAVERGRTFERGEDRPGNDGVVIISHELWRAKFNGDPDILDRTITLNGINRQVIGITPASFSFPSTTVQFWIPARIDSGNSEDYWGGEFVPLIARLRPRANSEQAKAEIHSLAQGIWKLFPWPMPRRWNADSTAISLQSDLAGDTRTQLFILLGAVGTVLGIACANVASLLLARATARRKEVAMRAALGAGTARIMRQLLTESVVLALAAGVIGVLLGSTSLSLFRAVVPAEIPGMAQVGLDWRVCVFAAALSILTGLAFGIVPALNAGKLDLVEAMRSGSQRFSTKTWIALRGWLIAGEIALTVVLVVGAGLLMKSLYDLTAVNPGFNSQRILTIKISPNESFCTQRESCIAFYSLLIAQARGLRGVVDAAIANTVPLDGQLPAIPADVEDHPRTPDFPSPMLWTGAVASNYFRLMQIPLISGRAFTEADAANASPVILISASTARRFWPGGNPIGKHIRKTGETSWRTVIGVVADVRQFDLANHSPGSISGAIYMPYAQAILGSGHIPAVMDLLVKTTATAEQVAAELRRVAVNANPNVPVGRVMTLTDIVGNSISGFRSTIWVFLSFASAALLLAAIGLYGLMSYSVSQRTYEISVRMAIGAPRSSVAGLILSQSLRITMIGIVSGIVAAFLLSRLLSKMLVGVTATDPLTFAGVVLLVLIVAVTASSVPAWRAARIDPIRTLRAE